MVDLGGKVPAWGLSRWEGAGLRFRPPDDEGFTLRGNSRQLLYRGRNKSHRITILGDSAFEYDCILNREPDSNVVTLGIEGAEQFDFFRQPDFVQDPFLKGSYAVYKKETLIGEGTGKLCHIHRPKIIDVLGRNVWGSLHISGNMLTITIPEQWLANAKYPVVVDPVIGMSALGAFGPDDDTEIEDPNNYWGYDDWNGMELPHHMGVNKFTAPHNITGNCTAYLYVDYYPGGYFWSTTQDKVWPVLYTHNSQRNWPNIIKSSNGGYISNDVGRTNPVGPPRGWRNTNITVDGTIQQGEIFWFGFHFWRIEPRFDYGGELYRSYAPYYQNTYAAMRQKYYNYPIEIETEWEEDAYGNEIEVEVWCDPVHNLKISMYLDYTVSAINYTRTLTQGVKLADNRKLTGTYKRTATQTVKGSTVLKNIGSFYRNCVMNVQNSMVLKRFESFYRNCLMSVQNTAGLIRTPTFIRMAAEQINTTMEIINKRTLNRTLPDQTSVQSSITRHPVFLREVLNSIKASDYSAYSVVWLRYLSEQETALDQNRHISGYIRSLYTMAGSLAETSHTGEYYRKQMDTTTVEGVTLRHLFIFIRLITTGFVRDFIIRRFLKSNEDIVLKSPVCREIEIESHIH
jgi:hypothetical protein